MRECACVASSQIRINGSGGMYEYDLQCISKAQEGKDYR